MDTSGHPDLVTSPEINTPGNLEILAQTAASQTVDDSGSFAGYPGLKISGNANILLQQHISIGGQPGGPMLGQSQLHRILNSADPDKGLSAGPLSIITTTSINDQGQTSPASMSQGSQILQYRPAGASGDAMLSAINYNENEILQESAFDVGSNLGNLDDGLLSGIGNPARLSENPASDYGLFDGDGDSLNMETLSPQGLLISDAGGLASVSVSESGDSSISDTMNPGDDRKKVKIKSKNGKGQVSPGKGGPVECNQCHKSFNNTSALAKHKLTHSDERKFLCTICEKKFKRQDHLNGHLMTHRDKKPYQCMVSGCDKSYCDARSLKRHLENHHQHTSEQILTEMVTAASQAAEILAEVSVAQPVTHKSPLSSTATNSTVLKSSSAEPVIQAAASIGQNTTQIVQAKSDNNILAQQLLITQALNQTGTPTLVTLAVSGGQVTTQDVNSQLQQQATAEQFDSFQDQVKIEPTVKIEAKDLEAFKQQQLKEMEIRAIATVAQMQREHSPSGNIDMSPGYTEMSPGNDRQPVPPESPGRSQVQVWLGQTQHNTPAPNTTVADVKQGDEAKPVLCSICHRGFKNVPALNGHMRLHGGYFKKEAALKEEKKKKEMAPPISVPSRPGGPSVGSPQNHGAKKTKGTPPMQSPPSEELHQQHWQQKQELQLQQQLKQLQEQQQQQQLQKQYQQQQQQPQQQAQRLAQQQQQQQLTAAQTVQDHLKQIQQKMEQQQLQQQQQQLQQQLQQQQQQQQQQQELEQQQQLQQLQAQLAGQGVQINQAVANVLLGQAGAQQLSHLDLLQSVEQIKRHFLQQQQPEPEPQPVQQQQLMYDTGHHSQAGIVAQEIQQFNSPQHVPQSPHLPMSPQYTNPHTVPQSPQVPQSPLIQRQSSVEPLQSPGPDYGNQGLQVQDITMAPQFQGHAVHDFNQMQPATDNDVLLQNLHQQIQLQNQNIHTIQATDNISLQNAQIASLHNPNIPNSASMDMNNQLQQPMVYNNQAVNIQHAQQQQQHQYHSQVSGQFNVGVPSEGPQLGDNNASELMSQLITSLETLGEVPPGAMQIQKPDTTDLQLTNRVFPAADHTAQFQQQAMTHENGMNNSFNDFAQNSVMNIQGVSSSSYNTSQFVSQQPQVSESRGSVKQELLKHLASKPLSPRANPSVQFSFQNNVNTNTNPCGNISQRQRHHSAKAELNPHSSVSKISEANSELKRRLSAGPEDVRLQTFSSNPDIASRTYIRPSPNDDSIRPRIRSKSGDDFRSHKWRNEDLFTKPKVRVDDFAHRPRSKTDEHLPKWKKGDPLSKSDGGGVFRNPSSMAPGSFKIRRKNRPAPLIIPSHATNMCGFQSRLRSPRIYPDGDNGSKTAPVPYTPPPMLSPLRRGSGLFSSINSASTIAAGSPQPGTAGSISTQRPSLLRSASIQKVEKIEEQSEDTSSFNEEQPPPESDILPHVNIGSQYQAALPDFNPNMKKAVHDVSKEDLVFDPACLQDVGDDEGEPWR